MKIINRELTKDDTKMIKGLSVIAMVCLHLFNKSYEGLFSPILFIGDTPLSFYLSQISDLCIFGFAFCSGYAHMSKISDEGYYKNRLKALLALLCNYWLVLIVFVVLAIIIGTSAVIPESIVVFIKNFFLISNSYNGAWWYMLAFVIVVLLSPMILRFVNNRPAIITGILCVIIYTLGYYLRYSVGANNDIFYKSGQIFMVIAQYVIGAICFREKWISKLYSIYAKAGKAIRIIGSILITVGMIYIHTKIIPSNYISPFTGFVVIMLFTFWKKPVIIQKIALFIGDHSTNIWLTHMFFYSVLFTNFIYIAKYPILIFILMLCITIALSFALKFILKPINKLIGGI